MPACREWGYQMPVCYSMIEEVKKSKEGPFKATVPVYAWAAALIAREARHVQQRRLRPQADYNM